VAIRVYLDSQYILRVFGTRPSPCKESEKKPHIMPGILNRAANSVRFRLHAATCSRRRLSSVWLVCGRSLVYQVGFLVEMIVSAMWAIKRLATGRERGLGWKVEVL
jgi:hypothetical protein